MPRDNASERLDEIRSETPLTLSPLAPLNSARELVRIHYMKGAERTLHHQQGAFFRWTNTHYVETPPEAIRAVVYEFLDHAMRLSNDGKLVPFDPTRAKVTNVVDALAAAAQLPVDTRPPAWLDDENRPPPAEILACSNGLLHLPTRQLLPHTPSFFTLNTVEYPFDPDAPEPSEWMTFLSSIWTNDPASIDTLQELFGLLLTGDTSCQKMFLIVGPPRSGKGTIARVLTALLGRDSVAGPTLSGLSQNFGLAPLIGKPLAIISDARLGGRADAHVIAERLLAITGEDALTIDRKFQPAWTGRLPTRFLILTNELPRLTDASGALASRFVALTLTTSFLGHEDLGLTRRLTRELPGIFLWALGGRDRFVKRGHFVQPPSASEALQELQDLASPIGAFLRDRCVLDHGRSVSCDGLFNAWVDWCRDQGRDHAGTKHVFGRDLRAAVPAIQVIQPRDSRTGKQVRYYEGLGLNLW